MPLEIKHKKKANSFLRKNYSAASYGVSKTKNYISHTLITAWSSYQSKNHEASFGELDPEKFNLAGMLAQWMICIQNLIPTGLEQSQFRSGLFRVPKLPENDKVLP